MGFQDTTQAISDLTKQLAALKTALTDINAQVSKTAKSQEDLKIKQDSGRKAVTQLSATQKEYLALQKKLKVANSDSIQKNEELKVQLTKQKKVNKELAREKLGLVGAYEKESKKLTALRTKYKDLVIQGNASTKSTKALKNEITKLDSKIKGVDASVGQHQRNVGNYGSAMTALPGPIGNVINSMKMLTKVIFATPLGWIIGLIAAAGATLKTFFAGSVEGQERWNKTMERAKAVGAVFKDEIINIGKNISNFIDRIKESDEGLKGWATSVKDNALKSWSEFRENVSDNGLWETVKGGAENAIDSIKNKFDELDARIQENLIRAEDIAARENALRFDEIDSLTEVAKIRQEIAELRAKAADKENVSASKRIDLLGQAIAKENEVLAVNEEIAKERIKIQKLQMDQGENTIEDYETLAQLESELIGLQTTNAERRRRFTSEQQSAINEEKAAYESASASFIENLNAENAAFEETLTDRTDIQLQAALELSDTLDKQRLADYQKEIDDFEGKEEEKLKLAESNAALMEQALNTAADVVYSRASERLDDELSDYQDNLDDKEEALDDQLEAGTISQSEYDEEIAKLEEDSAEKQAEIERKKALYSIAIDTLLGSIKAIAASPLTFGQPMLQYVIASGAISAAGVAAAAFEHGTDGALKEDTTAWVSEGGQELGVLNGNMFLTPKEKTKAFLPEGTQIFPNYSPETQAVLNGGLSEDVYISEQAKTRKMLSKIGRAKNAVMTDKGIKVNGKTYIDRYRGKQ